MNLFKTKNVMPYVSSKGDKVYPIVMDIKTGIVEGKAVFTTGDIDTAYLYTTILEEQSEYNIVGTTVVCNIQRPDGTTMKIRGDVQGNNLIEFPLGQSGVSQEGIYNFDIAVVFSEKKMVTSPTAQYSVTQSIEVNGEIEEDDRFPVLERLISDLNVINEEELVRVSNEEVRQAKEEAREQAESVRVRNEETRLANNEAIRNEEAVRVVNENERKNAESLRVQEENKRKQQENTRIAQETNRVNEENVRKNQEQARVTAEGNRVTSENVRVSAEQARVLKEQERQAIEVERQNSEATREQQEATRVSQEDARKQADILRQQEHESRQQFLDGFEGKLNTVVDDVATIKDDVVAVKEANKRQDVFLQGLYNENLDGRVTIKEEGSVIPLTNSDNGLVDIVGLEGNTLVNYVQDGAKELTLNGDIDVEGTSVTLTEGVDGGLVDVACEGNTLVNEIKFGFKDTVSTPPYVRFTQIRGLKPNTTYTAVTPYFDSSTIQMYIGYSGGQGIVSYQNSNVVKFTTGDTIHSNEIWFYYRGTNSSSFVSTLPITHVILEGDWTNKEIPQYFEGMKSVAELEGNKIEILLQNKNLFDGELELGSISTSHGGNTTNTRCIRSKNYIKVRPNTTIIQSNDLGYESIIYIYDKDKNLIAHLGSKYSFTIPENGEYIRFRSSTGKTENNLNVKYQFEEGSVATSYVPHSNNKKEISLSEPLRGLPNGVKDKIVKIGGKWYIHRRLYGITLNGGENEKWNIGFTDFGTPIFTWNNTGVNICRTESYFSVLSDRFIYGKQYSSTEENHKCIYVYNYEGLDDSIKIQYPLNSVEEFRTYLSSNPINVIIQLEVPIYEELPIDPTLNTYNDITHISNNSTIPCNMKIQNSGYNAIIKPNTKYTVAFDTNKIGEVGINLGGSKVTTTNNVATVTTPSILTDDSLRLTGKGIKASKIRLLEGDKTNWIPSHFEGMESCFKDNNIEIKVKSGDKENSINIQLNEPLRGIGNFKDRLVFKDGKLMIERNCGAREYQEGDLELDSSFTDKINTIYVLSEPYYEEVSYEAQKLILEGYENGTLFFDTNIPPTVTANYTANIPVVSELNKNSNEIGLTQEDLSVTQVAVDFLLMSNLGEEMLSSFNVSTRGRNSMGAYFANRIMKGALKYEDVISKYPQYKEEIDSILETK